MNRRRVAPELDPAAWPAFDTSALPKKQRSSFKARQRAVELYAANTAVAEIERRTGVDRRQLYRLLDCRRYASLQEACEAAVAAEIANGEMYERLLGATQRTDILTVLSNLQQASQQRHLPAFQRCAQRGTGGRGAEHHRHRERRGAQR